MKLSRGSLWRRRWALRVATIVLLTTTVLVHVPCRLLLGLGAAAWMSPGMFQTDGADTQYWQAVALANRLTTLGWEVQYRHGLMAQGGVYGHTNRAERIIAVDIDLHWNDTLKVLAHEGGHGLQPPWLTHAQSEVFAGSVALLVGGGSPREYARQLATYKGDLWLALAEWRAIYHAAAILTDP